MAGLAGPIDPSIPVEAARDGCLRALPADGLGLGVGVVGMVAVDTGEAPGFGAEWRWGYEDLPVDLQERGRMGGGRGRSCRPATSSWGARRRGGRGCRGRRRRGGWWG